MLSFSNGSGSVTASHTYVLSETYTVTVTVTDAENMSDSAQTTITVSDAPPQVSLQNSSKTLFVGSNEIMAATITDELGSIHTAEIDWGDGTVEAAIVNGSVVFAAHTYSNIGSYTATLTVTDGNGLQGSDLIIFDVVGSNASIAIPSAGVGGLASIALTILMLVMFRAYRRRARSIL